MIFVLEVMAVNMVLPWLALEIDCVDGVGRELKFSATNVATKSIPILGYCTQLAEAVPPIWTFNNEPAKVNSSQKPMESLESWEMGLVLMTLTLVLAGKHVMNSL